MKAIVAIDNLWGIGKDGKLLFHIKEDMEFFKKMTTGKVVVMGRKTLDSLPNGNPLKDRVNLIITSKPRNNFDNTIFGDMDAINEEIKKYSTNDIFIIGGSTIYKQLIHRCDTIYVTHNTITCEADSYMPILAFEGFVLDQVICSGTTNSNDWNIEKWITSECEPYKSILWLNDSDNNVLFLYSNDLINWNDVYNNDTINMSKEFKEQIMNIMPNSNKNSEIIKIHDYYRAEIYASINGNVLRLASFGGTEDEAFENLMVTLTNILE